MNCGTEILGTGVSPLRSTSVAVSHPGLRVQPSVSGFLEAIRDIDVLGAVDRIHGHEVMHALIGQGDSRLNDVQRVGRRGIFRYRYLASEGGEPSEDRSV